jgi:enoyl-CoA hydratase/carnithine racemase
MAEIEPTVIARREGAAGSILMNRQRALNALDLDMIERIHAALRDFRDDPAVRLVVLEGSGGRAFCAGGDVRRMRELALAGARMKGAEAVEAGLATHAVPRADLPALRAALLDGDAGAVARFAQPVPPGAIAAQRPAVDRCFTPATLPAIRAALAAEGSDWAREQTQILDRMSPTSMAVTLELLRRGAGMNLAECLAMELALTRSVTRHPDFAEGVRAVLVDKDNAPRWAPQADVAAMFAP